MSSANPTIANARKQEHKSNPVMKILILLIVLVGIGGAGFYMTTMQAEEDNVQELTSETEILGVWQYEPRDSKDMFSREIDLLWAGGFLTQSSGGPYREKSKDVWRAGEWHVEESETENESGETELVKELVVRFDWVRNLITREELDIASANIEERFHVQLLNDGQGMLLTPESGEPLAFKKIKRKTVQELAAERAAAEAEAEGDGS